MPAERFCSPLAKVLERPLSSTLIVLLILCTVSGSTVAFIGPFAPSRGSMGARLPNHLSGLSQRFGGDVKFTSVGKCCDSFDQFRYSDIPSTMLHQTTPKGTDEKTYDAIMRFELKNEILRCANDFKEMQREMFAAEDKRKEEEQKKKKGFLGRWRKGKKDDKSEDDADRSNEKRRKDKRENIRGLFGANTMGVGMVELGDKGDEIVALAERLATFNPTKVPTYGWKKYRGGSPNDCPLDGRWKLQFTTGSDATFRESPKRGKATTSQEVDAAKGTLTNVIDFERGKLKGFRVVVAGTAISDDMINLTFKRVVIFRDSRFPRLFGKIVVPLPNIRFLLDIVRFLTRSQSKPSRAGFQVKYVDDDFRMHKTGDGNWFIQTRLK